MKVNSNYKFEKDIMRIFMKKHWFDKKSYVRRTRMNSGNRYLRHIMGINQCDETEKTGVNRSPKHGCWILYPAIRFHNVPRSL
mmetsp:Transcript_511/g.1134  ORF Transcript_511/g.1134 Transcript_511/m.1134 type:complete len:83 (+) Transcript_511:850-1098(+)